MLLLKLHQDQPYCFFKTGGPEPSLCKNNGPRYDCGMYIYAYEYL